MKWLVFHVVSTEDTKDFSPIYENLPESEIHINPEKSKIIELLGENPEADIIAIGHGDENGLWCEKDGYCIDNEVAPLLRRRFVIGVWCFAAEYADRYDLRGFFTSDFISNSKEFTNRFLTEKMNKETIQTYNKEFSVRLNRLLLKGVSPMFWPEKLRELANNNIIERYNYETLCYYE